MLDLYMSRGKILKDLPKPREIRDYVLDQLRYVEI
jgi:hypothetical protein